MLYSTRHYIILPRFDCVALRLALRVSDYLSPSPTVRILPGQPPPAGSLTCQLQLNNWAREPSGYSSQGVPAAADGSRSASVRLSMGLRRNLKNLGPQAGHSSNYQRDVIVPTGQERTWLSQPDPYWGKVLALLVSDYPNLSSRHGPRTIAAGGLTYQHPQAAGRRARRCQHGSGQVLCNTIYHIICF